VEWICLFNSQEIRYTLVFLFSDAAPIPSWLLYTQLISTITLRSTEWLTIPKLGKINDLKWKWMEPINKITKPNQVRSRKCLFVKCILWFQGIYLISVLHLQNQLMCLPTSNLLHRSQVVQRYGMADGRLWECEKLRYSRYQYMYILNLSQIAVVRKDQGRVADF
jgi:hypothetical protein